MREHDFLAFGAGGFRRVAYAAWGAPEAAETVVCVHGLTRNGRDFDFLAAALAGPGRRVICPDVAGRGRSDWLADPSQYAYPTYMNDMAMLLAHLDARSVDWVGTSMGGLIGLFLAIQPNTPIRRLVLNDIGAQIPQAALARIAGYVGLDRVFDSAAAALEHLKSIQSGWGALSDAQWAHMARHGLRQDSAGGWRLGHDPGILAGLGDPQEVQLWPAWQALRCPVLLLHGAQSDVLTAETVARMGESGPPLSVVSWPGIGHAPSLMDPAQIATVRDWLATTPA
ncbi:MAG TPA: alpha/beta hydrolase [Gammaproteobacteria bacterium]